MAAVFAEIGLGGSLWRMAALIKKWRPGVKRGPATILAKPGISLGEKHLLTPQPIDQ